MVIIGCDILLCHAWPFVVVFITSHFIFDSRNQGLGNAKHTLYQLAVSALNLHFLLGRAPPFSSWPHLTYPPAWLLQLLGHCWLPHPLGRDRRELMEGLDWRKRIEAFRLVNNRDPQLSRSVLWWEAEGLSMETTPRGLLPCSELP